MADSRQRSAGGARTFEDFWIWLDIAKGSTGDVRSMYYAAEDLKYVSADVAEARRTRCRQIGSGISSLAAHLRPESNSAPRRTRR